MSFLDDLRKIPVTPQKPAAVPRIREPMPLIGPDMLREVCIDAQKKGKRALDLVLASLWDAEGDGDGGWMPPKYHDGFGQLMTEEELKARMTTVPGYSFIGSRPKIIERYLTDNWGEAPGHSSTGWIPHLYQVRENAQDACGRIRQFAVQLGFPESSVSLMEIRNVKFQLVWTTGLFSGGYKVRITDPGELLYTAAIRLRW